MVTGDVLGVCPIIDEIEGHQFKAAIMFAADTTLEQAKALNEHLEELFRVLRDKVLADNEDTIAAKHQEFADAHSAELAAQEEKAQVIAQQKADEAVNVEASSASPSADEQAAKKLATENLQAGIKELREDVHGIENKLAEHSINSAPQSLSSHHEVAISEEEHMGQDNFSDVQMPNIVGY
jgi:hypothetical protein